MLNKQVGADKIYLSHNQGIYLYNHTLAVLSIHLQHLFKCIGTVCQTRQAIKQIGVLFSYEKLCYTFYMVKRKKKFFFITVNLFWEIDSRTYYQLISPLPPNL